MMIHSLLLAVFSATPSPIATSEPTLSRVETSTPTEVSMWPVYGYAATSTPSFDIPLHHGQRVQKWIRHFQKRGRKRFGVWMARAARAAPRYYGVFGDKDLPLDSLFLSMIESGFSSRAVSWASAAGAWQFMPRTGRRFDLEYSAWVDERLNVDKATVAAARYLGRLYKEFDDWHLAWAAYNAGEARIRRGLRKSKTKDFWSLSETRHLPRETREYVPKLIAAAIVSKSPERFGLDVPDYLDPVPLEVMTVTVATDLKTIAQACGGDVTEKELLDLNAELYRRVTPPGRTYSVKVPQYWAKDCETGLRQLAPGARWTFRFHRMRKGEDIEAVAKKYGTQVSAILEHNKIKKAQFQKFEAIVIPIPHEKNEEISILSAAIKVSRVRLYTPDSPPVRIHRVRNGDSLWKIARRYRVSLRKLRRWNGIYRNRYLRIGERLVIRGRSG
jgi:membrane-bound lytic murein transglycosylase D